MKIGLISDTHSYLDPKVFDYFKEVDEIWHAGDVGSFEVIKQLEKFKPLYGVYGNIDSHQVRAVFPEDQKMLRNGVKIWMTHIGGKPPRYNKRTKPLIESLQPDIFICGHSHICAVMHDPKRKNVLYVNPGAAGIHGFHKMRTIMRFDLEEGKIKNLQVIELGLRAKPKI